MALLRCIEQTRVMMGLGSDATAVPTTPPRVRRTREKSTPYSRQTGSILKPNTPCKQKSGYQMQPGPETATSENCGGAEGEDPDTDQPAEEPPAKRRVTRPPAAAAAMPEKLEEQCHGGSSTLP
jgi:hypothetical protein